MFTGIVETIGTLKHVGPGPGGLKRLTVALPPGVAWDDVRLGDSVCVSGVCLTATRVGGSGTTFVFDAIPETLKRSSLGVKSAGAPLNLERSLPADGRFHGHIMQGHVDAVGTLARREDKPGEVRLSVQAPREVLDLCVEKGSIAIDGTSLTITALEMDALTVALIPATLAATTLGTLVPGDPVNLEADIVGKYVQRLLTRGGAMPENPIGGGLSAERLRELGY